MTNESSVPQSLGAKPAAPSLADLLALSAQAQAKAKAAMAPAPRQSDTDSPQESGVLPSSAQLPTPAHTDSAAADATATVPLLLVHAGLSEGALVQTWMQHVLKGGTPHLARFQDNVLDLVQTQQPHAILIQFDPHCLDAAVAMAAQLQASYPHIPRLAIGRSKYAQCMLAALRTGVQDFLDIDALVDTAQQAVLPLVNRPPATRLDARRAPRTAIVSARAGAGCSLLAAHLSWHLQAQLAQTRPGAANPASPDDPKSLNGLLIELGNPGGDCALYLNTPGEFGFTDAVSQQRRLDRRMAQSALARHDSGLRLLTLARQAPAQQSTEVQALLRRLSEYFAHIVVDLGATQSPQLLQDVLPSADEIWVVCEQSVASVVWTAELLQQFDALHIERRRLRLVVSRHDSHLELTAEQIARQLELPLLAQLPERRRELAKVVNQGQLLAPHQRREPYVQAIDKLVAGLLSRHHPELAPTNTASASPLTRLLQRIRKN